jgi:hypothetical protein
MSDTESYRGITIGDRVTWQHRPPREWEGVLFPAKMLTGTVRGFRSTEGGHLYAIVGTEPDGRITLPALDLLTKVEKQP